MNHRRSTTYQPPALSSCRKSILRVPSDTSLYSCELFPSEGSNARQRNKDIKLKLKVASIQSITSLVDELEKGDMQSADLYSKTEELRASTSAAELIERRDWSREASTTYRDILALKLSETHEHLDKLIWDMQDALDQIVFESQKQVDCLDEIEDLFDFVKKGKPATAKAIDRIPLVTEEKRTEDTEALSPVFHFSTSISQRTVVTVDKGCQCGEFIEDTFSLALLENRHCQYMFEVFSHLRFVLEIVSPIEIERPDKSKFIPEINSNHHSEHRLRLKGTIYELNSQLVDIYLLPKARPSGNMVVPRFNPPKGSSKLLISPIAPETNGAWIRMSVAKPLSQSKLMKDLVRAKARSSVFTGGISTTESIQLNVNLRLTTLDPYLMQQTRPLPMFFQAATKVKYAEIERIQMMMPEVADIRFNISDVLRPEMRSDEFYVNSYFMMGKKDLSETTLTRVEEDVTISLHLHRFLLKRRAYLRLVFLSYNMESMRSVSDMLAMDFATFVRLLKDCLLICPGFDLLAAAKVYYLSSVKNKELPEAENEAGQRKWFKHLLNSYNFKTNYRLKLSGFLEAIIRLTYYHPRFLRLAGLRPAEKLTLLYKRTLKPNARLIQGCLYSSLLKDIHISSLLVQFEPALYEIFQAYMTRLTAAERMSDFIGKDKKLDLFKFYSFLSNAEILIDAEIVTIGNSDIEEEIDELNDVHHDGENSDRRKSLRLKKNQQMNAKVKESTIRFPSSMFDRVENQHVKMRASRNVRQSGDVRDMILLPFYRPVRSVLQIDKLTAFSFFVVVMKSIDTIFTLSPTSLSDTDFCLDFKEFCDVIGMLGILYWKTVTKCLDMSMVEGLATFVKSIVEKFRYMREFLGMTQAEKDKMSIQLLKQISGPIESIQTKPLITKTMVPQERFLTRRESI